MAKKTKSRLIPVRLLSMAMTGFFYSCTRPRTSRPMSMLKYDPVGTSLLFASLG
ncbi:50S ribosomal protein L33 [Jackrogersella minutella]|nr:50S ribosomal protein L33 [Jackrogersella minutella]